MADKIEKKEKSVESREEQRRSEDRSIEKTLESIGRKLLVMSGKGGVGKSTVAVNLSVALAGRGYRVGLLDVDLHGPNTSKMLGLERESLAMKGNRILPLSYGDRLRVVSMSGLLSSDDTAVIWRGPVKIGVIRQLVADVDWGELDYLVVDSPPGTGDEPLTVAQTITGSESLIVTTPQAVSLLDIRRSITFSRQVSMPILGLIENMSGLDCPHCGRRIDLFGSGGGSRIAAEMGVPFLGVLPIEPLAVKGGDEGRPFVTACPRSSLAEAFGVIVDRVVDSKS